MMGQKEEARGRRVGRGRQAAGVGWSGPQSGGRIIERRGTGGDGRRREDDGMSSGAAL